MRIPLNDFVNFQMSLTHPGSHIETLHSKKYQSSLGKMAAGLVFQFTPSYLLKTPIQTWKEI